MSGMDARIILAGNNPDLMTAFGRGQEFGARGNEIRQQNALRSLFQQQGPQIMAGDQNALNALSQFDPAAAMDIQAKRQSMADAKRRMEVFNANERRAAEEYAASKTEAERKAQAAKIEEAVRMGMAAQSPEQWDQLMSQVSPDLVGRFADRDMIANKYMSFADILKRQEGPKPADEYQRYVQEEIAAGRKPLTRIDFAKAKQRKSVIETRPDGSVRIVEGGTDSEPNVMGSPTDRMIASIDGILSDPALDTSTGLFSPLQNIPGTPQKRFQGRANQLSGQAFLQAFESLKGGGQITEIEGQKATQAIGRLDTAQSADDYRSALTELRSILAAGAARPPGWVERQRKIVEGQGVIPAETIMSMSPDQIEQLGADVFTRIPITELKNLTPEQWDALERLAEKVNQ